MPFVAISIDLCGSTQVKQQIAQLARDEHDVRDRLFSDYKRLFFDIERNLYTLVLNNPLIDFSRLSLIKSIGDELWYAYRIDEAPNEEQAESVRHLLFCLLELISQERILPLARDDEFGGDDQAAYFDLPIKVYADIVDGYEELNRERYEHLKQIVAQATGVSSAVIEIDSDYMQICERLNLGVPDLDGARHAVYAREDFIGLEIDRFFRLAKLCIPRLMTIGNALFQYTGWDLRSPAVDLEHLDLKVVDIGHNHRRSEDQPVYAIRRPVEGREMKGIHEDYLMFHLFDRMTLGEYFEAPSPLIDSLMGPTRAYLAEKGFFAVINRSRIASI